MKNNIHIPELSLVVLIGTSASGKTTFGKQHFLDTEVISSDTCRAMVEDNENSLDANSDAFDLVHYIIEKRLKRGKLTVVDATNIRSTDRYKLVQIARKYHVFPAAIILDIDKKIALERNKNRARILPNYVIKNQTTTLKRDIRKLKKEGFRYIHHLKEEEEINNITVIRDKFWNNKKDEKGAFDIIGDIHGCYVELKELLSKLGYKITKHRDKSKNYGYSVKPPNGRKVIFVGDLVDRGPASNEVLRLVMSMVKTEQAFCVNGNHDDKLKRKLEGRNVQIKHGLKETLAQLKTEPESFIMEVSTFLQGLISHYIFDDGKLCVAHAGLRENLQGRTSGTVRSFALYGDTTGTLDAQGLPIRLDWAKDYKGKALVVYGHTPIAHPHIVNNTINIDSGCVYGHKLTAFQYPEKRMVAVSAKKEYAATKRDFLNVAHHYVDDGMLHLEDVIGKKQILHAFGKPIMIREENAAGALETMSRFTVNPKWLAYLPPTMSPAETSTLDDYLEHPNEAFSYFQKNGVEKLICEEKHMGSRAVILIGKNKSAIETKFGIDNHGIGRIITRTGRAFFKDDALEQLLLKRFNSALTKSNFWDNFNTEWAIFDAELMPWSAKAMSLIETQYAGVGVANQVHTHHVLDVLSNAKGKHAEIAELLENYTTKLENAESFTKAYKKYCWDVNSIEDYKIAPFHIMATEGKVHHDKTNIWHMERIKSFTDHDPILMATPYRLVDLKDVNSVKKALDWWLEMTKKGGEGMVVKPIEFLVQKEQGMTVQPAIKCRGKEYLRIIYGANYTEPDNLSKLRKRSLGRKRKLAIQEFVLGLEALTRFVNNQPLRAVHECVFGVLAMESEAVKTVDSRL